MRIGNVLMVCVGAVACSSSGPTPPSAPEDQGLAAVTGRVLSKELGVMSGVLVNASPKRRIATTGADGQWTMNGLPPGLTMFGLSQLPAGCVTPETQPITLLPGASTRVHFLVDCSALEPNQAA